MKYDPRCAMMLYFGSTTNVETLVTFIVNGAFASHDLLYLIYFVAYAITFYRNLATSGLLV